MLILILVYLWDLLMILTLTVAGQQQPPLSSQTFDITIGKTKLFMYD
jgi:hypothetical protein